MLRIVPTTSAASAARYYTSGDYYTRGQEEPGRWRGQAAERLGLHGEIASTDWAALCDHNDPGTGKHLTARRRQDRTVGYDFNFHAPKSFSALWAITQDERLLETLREAVGETMSAIEAEAQVRVRKGGQDANRVVGNLIWGEFLHKTSRPLAGTCDPHLHVHCFVPNLAWDPTERCWKAGQFRELKRDAPYFEALFHAALTHRLAALGYGIDRTAKGWELGGVPASVRQKFSRRTAQIEAEAEAKGITDPKEKAELGARTREGKKGGLSPSALQAEWLSRLTHEELLAMTEARVNQHAQQADPAARRRAAAASLQFALDKLLERNSAVPERTLLTEALRHGYGQFGGGELHAAYQAAELIRAPRNGRAYVTTPAVLREEQRLIDFARSGRGQCRPFGRRPWQVRRTWLNGQQQGAVRQMLRSLDWVLLLRGAAGTGKTALLQEAVEAIEANGTKVHLFAPSAAASRGVLREEGFAQADTVARLLSDAELQRQVAGGLLWIDEASLLGSRTLVQLFELANARGCRVVLAGDRRQHGAVERGAALRLLEEEAGLVAAEVTEIQRQRGAYKAAVQALSDGRAGAGFDALDRLGWVREIPEAAERHQAVADAFVAALAAGETALVVSPTHAEGRAVQNAVRQELRGRGLLQYEEQAIPTLAPTQWTEAERRDPQSYAGGEVLQFHRHATGYPAGTRQVVESPATVPTAAANRFEVFRCAELSVAVGDWLRVTRNGRSADGHRLNNGAVYRLAGFTAEGNLVLSNGWEVARDFGHLALGYVSTSHAAQGRTVDRVFLAQSTASLPATSREQFYVSASRGRRQAEIFTDDKRLLRQAIQATSEQVAATDLLRTRPRRARLREHVSRWQRWQLQLRLRLDPAAETVHEVQRTQERESSYGR